ncbi:unnamed protein product, partial [Strongylus vulgaris]
MLVAFNFLPQARKGCIKICEILIVTAPLQLWKVGVNENGGEAQTLKNKAEAEKLLNIANAMMNMEGMLEAAESPPPDSIKLDEEKKKILDKKNPIPGPHHPTYLTMIKGAVLALNEGKGASKSAILKYLAQHYQLGENLPKA